MKGKFIEGNIILYYYILLLKLLVLFILGLLIPELYLLKKCRQLYNILECLKQYYEHR